ncbi:MAG: amidase [Anaerolineae bacterium]|nr:amidase [Anaerolineae bacterium]
METLLYTLGAAELARGIRAGDFSATEVVEAYIARLAAVNPHINALVTPMFDAARAGAAKADRLLAMGGFTPPALFGVPVTIKDAFPVAGVRFTAGSWFHRDDIADHDAAAVSRLKAAGAIILGKTNCPDMSWFAETQNLVFGLTGNPWNLKRTAGGSSGGEAAIIAAGGSPLGLGSDIAGSIRLPAAMCGAFGLKPTGGRISTKGHIPEAPPALHEWNTAGPLARSVEDLALALEVLSETPVKDYRQIDLTGRRAVVKIYNALLPVQQPVAETVLLAAGVLQAAGMAVVRSEKPPLIEIGLHYGATIQREADLAFRAALGGGASISVWREALANLQGRGRVSPKALAVVAQTSFIGLMRLFGFGNPARLERLRERMLDVMGPGGVLLCPVFHMAPPRHGFTWWGIYGLPAYTFIFNALRLPAASVPMRFTQNGLPLNVQIVGHPGEDETVLAVAAALERTFGKARIAPVN